MPSLVKTLLRWYWTVRASSPFRFPGWLFTAASAAPGPDRPTIVPAGEQHSRLPGGQCKWQVTAVTVWLASGGPAARRASGPLHVKRRLGQPSCRGRERQHPRDCLLAGRRRRPAHETAWRPVTCFELEVNWVANAEGTRAAARERSHSVVGRWVWSCGVSGGRLARRSVRHMACCQRDCVVVPG